tara:strand:+ start:18236 stop:18475 length:240 start_codon:yes stop_codon:yes gene_type:complete
METTSKRTYKKRTKKTETRETRSPEPVEKTISYGFWFTTAIRDGRVQFWQDKEIFIFFKNRGLTEEETKTRYDETLKLY